MERACVLAKEAGAKRAMLLSVSAPFHCSLMKDAADAMKLAFENVEFKVPSVPVITNVHAEKITDGDTLKLGLVDQICGRVRWRETLDCMQAQGVTEIVECGAGKVLSGMVRRMNGLNGLSLNTPTDIDEFVKTL